MSGRQVLVDSDLIRQVIWALMDYGSMLHAATSPHPEVQAVQKLESALRDALTLAQAHASAEGQP